MENKKYQIPFRYGTYEVAQIERICKLQRWYDNKNQAIKDALTITCDLLDFLESINENSIGSTSAIESRLSDLKTMISKRDLNGIS